MNLDKLTVEELSMKLLFAENQQQENAIIQELKKRGVL
jgi:hypothetical protein